MIAKDASTRRATVERGRSSARELRLEGGKPRTRLARGADQGQFVSPLQVRYAAHDASAAHWLAIVPVVGSHCAPVFTYVSKQLLHLFDWMLPGLWQ